MKRMIYLAIFIVFIGIASAQSIEVVKDSVQEIRLNDIIEINVHISNNYDMKKEFSIEEILPQDVDVISPEQFSVRKNDALEVKYYNWITEISPNSIKTITYKIRPKSLGDYSIGETRVTDNSDSRAYTSNVISFKVKCIPNSKCESNENSNTCPEDCSTGAKDGICDYKADNICDSDCTNDPDCRKCDFNASYITIPLFIIILIIIIFYFARIIFKKKQDYQAPKEEKINDSQIKYTKNEEDPLKGL